MELLIAVLTPPGRAAIASVAVEGDKATAVVSRYFRPAGTQSLADCPAGRILFGRWSRNSDAGEELVVARRSERRLEIHCHGGHAAVRAIVDALQEAGGRQISWLEMTERCEPNTIARDARIALAEARTDRTALILLDQYRGALQRALDEVTLCLQHGDRPAAKGCLDELLRYAPLGRHLTLPWQVVLAGLPNVGKSSLSNALLGFERSIVHAIAGTTRDVLASFTAVDGWPVEISDTAGLRVGAEAIESQGVERARARLARADVILLVSDISQEWTADEAALLEAFPNAVVVHNKCDLPEGIGGKPGGLEVSARTGAGIGELLAQVAQALVPEVPPAGAAVPFTESQLASLQAAAAALETGQCEEAARLLRA